jgi:hypothetical protein
MCIITRGKVVSTNILVAPLTGGRILTVYENTVELPNVVLPNAPKPTPEGGVMVLPFPGKDCEMYDFTNVGIFRQLEQAFPLEVPRPSTFGGDPFGALSSSTSIEVKQCGSYQYSVAKSFKDLDYLDRATFPLNRETMDYLYGYYPSNHGFLVCKLIPGKEKRHIAYKYKPHNEGGMVFIPTRHYHGKHEQTPEWDHRIYALNALLSNPAPDTHYRKFTCAPIDDPRIAWIKQGQGFPPDMEELKYISVLRVDGPVKNQDEMANIASVENMLHLQQFINHQIAATPRWDPPYPPGFGHLQQQQRPSDFHLHQQLPSAIQLDPREDDANRREFVRNAAPRLRAAASSFHPGPPQPPPGGFQFGVAPYDGPPFIFSPPPTGPQFATPPRRFFANDGEQVVPYFYTQDSRGIQPKFFVPLKYIQGIACAAHAGFMERDMGPQPPPQRRQGFEFHVPPGPPHPGAGGMYPHEKGF